MNNFSFDLLNMLGSLL